MPNRNLIDLFNQARVYLDTDDLNFPDDLCNLLFQRIWEQAVTMERSWRFLQMTGTQIVVAGTELVPMSFITDPAVNTAVPAERIYTIRWGAAVDAVLSPLIWTEYTSALKGWGDQSGTPVAWSELNQGPDRFIRLFPAPASDGVVVSDFYAELTYPASPVGGGPYDVTLYPLPAEFDSALLEGLLAEMYMREEDPDLYASHRQTFLEQTGAIRNHWRYSIDTPIVIGGKARAPSSATGPYFNDTGGIVAPAMR